MMYHNEIEEGSQVANIVERKIRGIDPIIVSLEVVVYGKGTIIFEGRGSRINGEVTVFSNVLNGITL